MKDTLLIFTDLDGTLLDHATYSWEAAKPALAALKKRAVPLVLCSSKTRAEMEPLCQELGLHDPFIVENGGAIYIPQGYFTTPLPPHRVIGSHQVLELGLPYAALRKALREISEETGATLRGYGDMTAEEIASLTGLSLEQAERAKQRGYDEPFIMEGSQTEQEKVLRGIAEKGLRWTRGGRFYHLTGPHDKGRAVKLLTDIYRKQYGKVLTVGFGDSLNDLPMLEAVDRAILVKRSDGTYDDAVRLPRLQKADGIGPVGWNSIVLGLLENQM